MYERKNIPKVLIINVEVTDPASHRIATTTVDVIRLPKSLSGKRCGPVVAGLANDYKAAYLQKNPQMASSRFSYIVKDLR